MRDVSKMTLPVDPSELRGELDSGGLAAGGREHYPILDRHVAVQVLKQAHPGHAGPTRLLIT